jgi:uncharacterized protein
MDQWKREWQPQIEQWVSGQMELADSGHGIDHVRRVVENANRIGIAENADFEVVLPAAWLHDCVIVSKNSPERKMASSLAATSAERFLMSIGYPKKFHASIAACIRSHSFSANVPCESIEAKVVQDADRLEAVGAIGLARCLMTGGSMGHRLVHPDQPFPIDRLPKDSEQSVDHFFSKLLGLQKTMQTLAGRDEAERRTQFLIEFLRQLCHEIGFSRIELDHAIDKAIGR